MTRLQSGRTRTALRWHTKRSPTSLAELTGLRWITLVAAVARVARVHAPHAHRPANGKTDGNNHR